MTCPTCTEWSAMADSLGRDLAAALGRERALREALSGIMEYEPEHCACGDRGCADTRDRYDTARAALARMEGQK